MCFFLEHVWGIKQRTVVDSLFFGCQIKTATTETQKPIHHSDMSDLPLEWPAPRNQTLSFSLSLSFVVPVSLIDVERAAGCSAILPRGTHKSLCWTCPLWPFISAIKPSCCPPVLTRKTPCHQLSGCNRSSRRSPMANKDCDHLHPIFHKIIWKKQDLL